MEVIQRRKVGRQDLISNITDGENEHWIILKSSF
jgi:hypothetical protein